MFLNPQKYFSVTKYYFLTINVIINIIFHHQHAAERGPGHLERGVEQLRAGGGGDPRLPAERGHGGGAPHPGRARRGAGRRPANNFISYCPTATKMNNLKK